MSSFISYDVTVPAASTMYLTVNFSNWHVNEDLALTVTNAAVDPFYGAVTDPTTELSPHAEVQATAHAAAVQATVQATCDSSFWEKGYDYKNGQQNHAVASSPADCCSKCAAYTG
jgi:hypothetical protein